MFLFLFCLMHQPNIFARELIPAKTNGDKLKSLSSFTKRIHDYFFISNFIFWSVLELLIFAQNFSTGVA